MKIPGRIKWKVVAREVSGGTTITSGYEGTGTVICETGQTFLPLVEAVAKVLPMIFLEEDLADSTSITITARVVKEP